MATLDPYDGVLLVSFGGPESAEQVLPFLRGVTAGRGIPDQRLAEVGRHYFARGGVSPIKAETRALRDALGDELGRRGVAVPVYWGNRHLEPSLAGALGQAATDGVRRLVAVLTSAYPSYSGCRQYREDLASALAALARLPAADRPTIDKIGPYAGHPGFAATMADLTWQATAELMRRLHTGADRLALVFVTHSLPVAADERSGPPETHGRGRAYTRWHAALADSIARQVSALAGGGPLRHDLVFCSRSGPPGQPWLEPDIADHLRTLADEGAAADGGPVAGVVVVPIGFVADHMEVVYDLDTVAAQEAARLGLAFARVPTVRTHPGFVGGLADLLVERAAAERGERAGGDPADTRLPGMWLPDHCAAGCCPNPRGPAPSVCGEDDT